MDRHQVRATLDGQHAVLECGICRHASRATAAQIDRINDFVAAHTGCVARPSAAFFVGSASPHATRPAA